MFGETTTISQVKVWNHHPTETTNLKWMIRVQGRNDALEIGYFLFNIRPFGVHHRKLTNGYPK